MSRSSVKIIYEKIKRGKISQLQIDNFFKKVKKTSHCWHWKGAIEKSKSLSYGRFKGHRSHRVSFLIHYGFMPKRCCVCHTCDNVLCVNPKHLWLGTIKQNNLDMVKKKRHARGEGHGEAKLTEKRVRAIRNKYKQGYTQRQISKIHRVDFRIIHNIIKRINWAHLR
jgi:hypothetical protein